MAYLSSTANTAVCFTSISKVESDTGTVSSPYQCTPTDTDNMCKYYYDSSNFVSTNCQCSLDGSNGYCPFPGATEF